MAPLVAMLSDFGHDDAYVGIMKCVVSDICPDVRIVDLCHEVPPQNLLSGAYLLATAMPYLPPGSIVVAVVDPGVGTRRRAVAVELDEHVLIGPDNGLFTLVFEQSAPKRAHLLENSQFQLSRVSSTFHGRDIFSPAGAHLAAGATLEELGPPVDPDDLIRLPQMEPRVEPDMITCRIIHIDHFGNAITNLTAEQLSASGAPRAVRVRGLALPLVKTFGDVAEGEPLAYLNSSDYLEISVRNGSAAERLELAQGDAVELLF